ncbi:MAG: TAXI family TRAP transporter solute-binding subunit [Xanthobacteraceae bacterium]
MATGPEGGAYHQAGKRYQAALAREGVRLTLVTTAGAVENLRLLHDSQSRVTVAFLQSGVATSKDQFDLESLGTLFYEPLWVFYRQELSELAAASTFAGLKGRRVSIGPEGSGGRLIAVEVLRRNEAEHLPAELLALGPQQAADQLLAGLIDVAFIMSSWDAPAVQQLIAHEEIGLSSFPRADAYVALLPYLSKLVLPAGVGDLAKKLPPSDVPLLASKASLIVRKELHSAIQYLLLEAVSQIHSGPSALHHPSRFPAAEALDFPLSHEASQFYRSGRPFLHHELPFWIASLVGRILVLVIPIVAVGYPIIRFVPALYDALMRGKVARLYGELRFLENDMERGNYGETIQARLDELEREASRLKLPRRYASMMYLLRDHIALVRERLKAG